MDDWNALRITAGAWGVWVCWYVFARAHARALEVHAISASWQRVNAANHINAAKYSASASLDSLFCFLSSAEARATKTDLAALQVEVGERAGRAEVAALQIEVRTVRETASSAVETSTSALAEAGAAASLAASSRTAAEDHSLCAAPAAVSRNTRASP